MYCLHTSKLLLIFNLCITTFTSSAPVTDYVDNLGKFQLPSHLLDKVKAYAKQPKHIEDESNLSYVYDTSDKDWKVIKMIKSSTGTAMHTVERRNNELRCSCQSYRIRKKGWCKHTKMVAIELGI